MHGISRFRLSATRQAKPAFAPDMVCLADGSVVTRFAHLLGTNPSWLARNFSTNSAFTAFGNCVFTGLSRFGSEKGSVEPDAGNISQNLARIDLLAKTLEHTFQGETSVSNGKEKSNVVSAKLIEIAHELIEMAKQSSGVSLSPTEQNTFAYQSSMLLGLGYLLLGQGYTLRELDSMSFRLKELLDKTE